MVIGVLGGRGQVGRLVMREAARRGHRPIALSRRAPREGEHRHLDVATADGLPAALEDVEALVDVLGGPPDVLVDGVARTLAAATRAGARHVVSLSILGADRVPLGYYGTKLAQEDAVRTGGLPWTLVRASQFHTLFAALFGAAARRGVLPLVRVPVQPVDPAEVAVALVDAIEAGPAMDVVAFGGPRVERGDRLARAWAGANGVRRLPLPVPAVGPVLRAVRAGGLTEPSAARGRRTFAAWLEGRP